MELGNRVKTEPRSSITPGSLVPPGCVVRAWACVTSALTDSSSGAKEIVGSPADFGKDIDDETHLPPITYSYLYLLSQMVLMYAISLVSFLGIGVSCVFGISIVRIREGDVAQLLYFVIAGLPVAFTVLLATIVVVKRTLLNRPKPGVLHTGTFFYLRVWFIDTLLLSPLLSLALEYLLPPSLYHYFLRAMGGRAAGSHTFWNSPQVSGDLCHCLRPNCIHTLPTYLYLLLFC